MKLASFKKYFSLFTFLSGTLFAQISFSQTEYMDYRSATNPLYWKNRKPVEGYWQQDVHYNIKAEINDSTDILSGNEELTIGTILPTIFHMCIFICITMPIPRTPTQLTCTKTMVTI